MKMNPKKKMKTPQFAIFDNSSIKHIDALQVSLLRAGKNTLLPELYDIFGKEKLLKFLDIFAGTTVKVPTKKVLEYAIRDTYIYLGMEKARTSGHKKKRMPDVVKDLAARYDIDEFHIWKIYNDMKAHF